MKKGALGTTHNAMRHECLNADATNYEVILEKAKRENKQTLMCHLPSVAMSSPGTAIVDFYVIVFDFSLFFS